MAKKNEVTEDGTTILTLAQLPFGSMIEINGNDFEFKGFEKRKTKYGIQQHFVFYSKKAKFERIFERFSFSQHKIKKVNGKYKW